MAQRSPRSKPPRDYDTEKTICDALNTLGQTDWESILSSQRTIIPPLSSPRSTEISVQAHIHQLKASIASLVSQRGCAGKHAWGFYYVVEEDKGTGSLLFQDLETAQAISYVSIPFSMNIFVVSSEGAGKRLPEAGMWTKARESYSVYVEDIKHEARIHSFQSIKSLLVDAKQKMSALQWKTIVRKDGGVPLHPVHGSGKGAVLTPVAPIANPTPEVTVPVSQYPEVRIMAGSHAVPPVNASGIIGIAQYFQSIFTADRLKRERETLQLYLKDLLCLSVATKGLAHQQRQDCPFFAKRYHSGRGDVLSFYR
jgi:hypothetical protein